MTLQQLRYFCVMAEVLHYTKAAKQLYISQPSLSYALSELSKELGVPLFGKSGKRTYLTQYGEAFLPYARNALAELSKGRNRTASDRRYRRRLREFRLYFQRRLQRHACIN